MYETYFNLSRKPFELLPNPEFLYLSKVHKRALTYLEYGIRERVGFILLTGDIGSGKTTLIRNLIRNHGKQVILAKVFNTLVDSQQLLAMINEDFGLSTQGKDKIALLRDLNEFLIEQFAQGKQAMLVIDEAQNLSRELLEEIRMLSNLEADNGKLLQIVLVGQPELRRTLQDPALVQLRQRIAISCNITPLALDETEQYIRHRLDVAGNQEAVSFAPEAFQIIQRFSRGIPRLINIICDFLMLAAFAEERHNIDASIVTDIIGDLDFENHFWKSQVNYGIEPQGAAVCKNETEDSLLLLREISSRLETLENDSIQLSKSLIADLAQKVSTLSVALKSHVEGTDHILSETILSGLVAKHSSDEPDVEAVDEQNCADNQLRGGDRIKRLFGF
jgi:putative secretion ATPase (PEP-CTERM system associated)